MKSMYWRKMTAPFGLLQSNGLVVMCSCSVLFFGNVNSIAQQVSPGSSSSTAPTGGSGDSLQEITVTARKRTESLIDTPTVVQVLGGDDLNRSATTDLSGLAEKVPQLHLATFFAGSGGSTSIRGIGSPVTDEGVESTVSMVFDGVQLSRGVLTQLGLLDVGNIQVLKGPQALFFGKNSPGGVIAITSRGPTDTWQGYVHANYEFNAREPVFEAAAGGPISDTLKIRVAAKYDDIDGYISNNARPAVFTNPFAGALPNAPATFATQGPPKDRGPNNQILMGRITLEWTPFEKLTAQAHIMGGQIKSKDGLSTTQLVDKCASGSVPYEFGFPVSGTNCSSVQPQVASAALPAVLGMADYAKFDGTFDSLQVDYDAGIIGFTSVTGFAHYSNNALDTADGNLDIFPAGIYEGYRQVSEELRVRSKIESPVNFVVGMLYESSTLAYGEPTFLLPGLLPPDPVSGSRLITEGESITKGTTYSPFVQALWQIRDDLELDVGARYTRETRSNDQYNRFVSPWAPILFGSLVPVGTILSGSETFNNVSPEATLAWHPQQEMTVYGAFKTGYKSGGFSTPAIISGTAASTDGQHEFQPEKASGGEIGLKARLLNDQLQVTTAIYDYTFKNLQESTFNSATLSYTTNNAAEATTRGVEGDLLWRPVHDLTLHASVSYNKGRFSQYTNSPCYATQPNCSAAGTQDLSGTRLPYSSDWIESAGFTLDRQLISGYWYELGGNAEYLSSFNTSSTGNPLANFGPLWLLDANIGIHSESDGWRLEVVGKNLLDRHYIQVAIDRTAATNALGAPVADIFGPINRPREIWLQLSKKFGKE